MVTDFNGLHGKSRCIRPWNRVMPHPVTRLRYPPKKVRIRKRLFPGRTIRGSMSKSAIDLKDLALSQEPRSPKPDEIREQLRAILSSPAFLGSKRSQQFLEYVC